MKNILFSLAVLCTLGQAKAQSVKFGVKAGINLSEMTNIKNGTTQGKSVAQTQETTTTTNFTFGGFVNVGFKNFSIQPGLSYITKGGLNNTIYKGNGYSRQTAGKLSVNYLELPVNLLVDLPIGPGNVFFGGGPYVDFGLSGTYEDTHTSMGTSVVLKEDVKFGSKTYIDNQDSPPVPSEIKNPAFGINALAGFKLNNGFLISAGYGFNFTQIANDKDQTAKLNTAVFSVGYCFR